MAESQPTRCGYTLRVHHQRGWRGSPLRTPEIQKRKRHEREQRTAQRVDKNSRHTRRKKLIESKASAQGQTVTDFLRQRALDYRLRQSPLEKERIRQLARIGSNMNQIARWANTYKKRAEAVEVITRLILLERELHEEENEPCT